MSGLILIGDESAFDTFITEFQKKEEINDIATSIYTEKILIENTRSIIKSLSYRSTGKRLFVLRSEITIEAQNALLKNLEELEANISVVICAKSLRNLLPTVISRCQIITLGPDEAEKVDDLRKPLEMFDRNQIKLWELIDKIEEKEILKKDVRTLLSGLRDLLFETDNKQKVFVFCKKTIQHSSLIERNNINTRIALERIFSD